jgi:DNA polymerase III epsilon subunit-like protein
MSNNVMVDLETLGKRAGSIIVAIGAVRFDKHGVTDQFYTVIDVEDAEKHGFTLDASTFLWWMKQNEQARKALYSPRKAPLPVAEALTAFTDFLGKNAIVWGNGANFDNKLLEAAYYLMDMEQPWPFWNDRCFRTVRSNYPGVARHEPMVAHHALFDAEAQAEHLIEIHRLNPGASIL